jgi:hypothetical protein
MANIQLTAAIRRLHLRLSSHNVKCVNEKIAADHPARKCHDYRHGDLAGSHRPWCSTALAGDDDRLISDHHLARYHITLAHWGSRSAIRSQSMPDCERYRPDVRDGLDDDAPASTILQARSA